MTGISSPIQATLKAVDSTLASVGVAAEAVHTSLSPLPSVTSDYNEAVPSSFVTKGIDAVRAQVQRGLPVTATPPELIVRVHISSSMHPCSCCHQKTALNAFATELQLTKGLDDRDDAVRKTTYQRVDLFAQHSFQLEDVLTVLSHSPNGPVINGLEEKVVSLLYHDLPHPPSTHVGQKFQFRSADGSGNSLTNPDLGKSFTPYSRSCSTTRSISDDQLPDPGLIFDTLLRRGVNNASSSIYLDVLWLNMNPSVCPSPRWTERLVLQLRGKFCPCLPGIS
jgi:linoleate 10R-lipoxygenase